MHAFIHTKMFLNLCLEHKLPMGMIACKFEQYRPWTKENNNGDTVCFLTFVE